MLTHRALSPKQDWPFFNNEEVIEEQFLTEIRPLTGNSSREIWRTHICANPQARHPQLLPDFAWAYKILESANTAYWQSEWEDKDGSPSLFHDWLCQTIAWPLDTRVIFSWSAEYSVETSWGIFCKHWRYFLFNDEGPILWSLQQPEAIRFMPDGLGLCRSPQHANVNLLTTTQQGATPTGYSSIRCVLLTSSLPHDGSEKSAILYLL